MRSFCTSAIAAICVLSIAMVTARADVSLGNLGATGSGGLGGLGQGIANAGDDFAVGFTTGTNVNFLELTEATFGLSSGSGSANVAVTLYDDLSGSPGSPLAWTNTAAVTSTPAKVTFTAPQFALSPSTPYWLVVDADAGITWWRAEPNTTPTSQNASGWSYTPSEINLAISPGWQLLGAENSLSISAVPEPASLLAITTAAVAVTAGYLRARSRKSLRSEV
jgi:hypothetical protein